MIALFGILVVLVVLFLVLLRAVAWNRGLIEGILDWNKDLQERVHFLETRDGHHDDPRRKAPEEAP